MPSLCLSSSFSHRTVNSLLRRTLSTTCSRATKTIAGTPVQPLIASLGSGGQYGYKNPDLSIDHLVIGGGVVGLSIAAALVRRWPEKTTYVVERNHIFGQETSSRNSEVIHAGLYYPPTSLKTKLCLQGRELIYQYCQQHNVAFKETQKLVVGGENSKQYLQQLKQHCDSLGPLCPPTRLLTGEEARQLEPDLSPSIAHALLSPRTGIVSSHELMASLELEIIEAEHAEIVYDTQVVRVDPHEFSSSVQRNSDGSQDGWVVQTVTPSSSSTSSESVSDALLAKVVINSSGLNGPLVLNSLLESMNSSEPMIPMWYSKGNYASYKASRGASQVSHLIYPVPDTTKGTHSPASLGTHLTLDLDGNIRFGPDTEWISPPPSSSPSSSSIDFWKQHLQVDPTRIESMYQQIIEYLPNIDPAGLSPDYAGIRPKLIGPGHGGFTDFQFLWHNSRHLASQKLWQYPPTFPVSSHSYPPASPAAATTGGGGGGVMLSLLGIESPGLTSSLAIGEFVSDLLATSYYPSISSRLYHIKNKGARNEEVSEKNLEAWA